MSKELKIILCLVMAAAFALIFVCGLNYLSLTKELHICEQQLAESRETWEQIAAEKEALQDDLRAKQKELKEAKLTLDETTERASELKAENEQLRKDIDLLKEKQNQDSK